MNKKRFAEGCTVCMAAAVFASRRDASLGRTSSHTRRDASRRDASLRDARYSLATISTERCNPTDCLIAQPFMLQ
ncbi:MAG: hypothetical protein LBD59_02105 [Prevotellaceae bacterium]|nr:hypothetical protein [Prevotellaceae bacterium]